MTGGGAAPLIRKGHFVWVDPDELAAHGPVVAADAGRVERVFMLVREYRIKDSRRVLRALSTLSGDMPDPVLDPRRRGACCSLLGVVVLCGGGV